MYPFKFQPVFQKRIWGGRNLAKLFKKKLPTYETVGESWEISAHPNGLSTVANGSFAGRTIPELLKLIGRDMILGTSLKCQKFPLLLKLLDANDKLSVQVHPNDNYAYSYENGQSGKSEMWYILNAEPGAEIVYGLKEGVRKHDFLSALESGNIERLLNYVPVQTGDIFYIPAGLIHALGAGLMVAEIQQDSDLTYRVYDYNRTDDSGTPRQLHVEKALEVINFTNRLPFANTGDSTKFEGAEKNTLCECDRFNVEKISVFREYRQKVDGSRFYIIMVIAGKGSLVYENGQEEILLGDAFLIPAGLGDFSILGECEVILAYIP